MGEVGAPRAERRLSSPGRVLVLHEKHGVRVFEARSDDALERSALFVLAERDAEGWFEEPEPEVPPITDAEIEALPEFARGPARYEQRQREVQVGWRRRYAVWYAQMRRVVDSDGAVAGASAWLTLRSRDEYEYERVELLDVLAVVDD